MDAPPLAPARNGEMFFPLVSSSQALSPRSPLFASLIVGYACAYKERGVHGCLKVCIPGCFDGFERMDHAMETQTSSRNPFTKPLAIPLPRRKGARG